MLSFNIGSVKATVLALRNVGVAERAAAERAMLVTGEVARGILQSNVSYRDHDLAALAKLDHPYAVRHGKIRIHRGGGSEFLTNSTSAVHSQSGKLASAVYMRPMQSVLSMTGIRIGIDAGIAPHAAFVVQGTRVMLPRDVVNDTLNAPGTQRVIMRTVVKVFGAEFKAQAGIRFVRGGNTRASATSTGSAKLRP